MDHLPALSVSAHSAHSAAKHSRFLLAAHSNPRRSDSTPHHLELEKYRQIVVDQNAEIKALRKELEDKEESIKSLQYSLLQQNERTLQLGRGRVAEPEDSDSDFGAFNDTEPMSRRSSFRRGHRRRKSLAVEETEKSAMDNVRNELRSGITEMASAQHEVARLLQSVGDSSVIHGRLKKIEETLSMHNRKVSALEQTLNTDALRGDGVEDVDHETLSNGMGHGDGGRRSRAGAEQTDIGLLSSEYNRLRVEMAEMRQHEKRWSETKQKLAAVNKRCANLMKMMDRMSDEKLELTLKIEDLQTLLNQHRIPYQM